MGEMLERRHTGQGIYLRRILYIAVYPAVTPVIGYCRKVRCHLTAYAFKEMALAAPYAEE